MMDMHAGSKIIGLILAALIVSGPSVALACVTPAMQECQPCCPSQNTPHSDLAVKESAPAAPCCSVSSGSQAPKSESELKTATTGLSKAADIPWKADVPALRHAAAAPANQLAAHPPTPSLLCTFLI